MSKSTLNIEVITETDQDLAIDGKVLSKVEHEAAKLFSITSPTTVTVILSQPDVAKRLNQEHRGKDYIPDVLTFRYAEDEGMQSELGEDILGELVVTPEVVKRQAKERGHSEEIEFTILVIHGIVHMMGFEHEGVSDEEVAAMRKHEEALLNAVGLSAFAAAVLHETPKRHKKNQQ